MKNGTELDAAKVEKSYQDMRFAVALAENNGMPFVALNKNTAKDVLNLLDVLRKSEKAEG